jgi:outer membrane autotransporter protein
VSSYVETQQSAAQSRLDAAFGEGSSTNGGLPYVNAPGFWIAGFASQHDYDATGGTPGSDIGYSGFAIGADTDVTADLRAGILGGWGKATIASNSFFTSSFAQDDDDEAEGAFGAVYARARSGAFFLDAALSGGLLDQSGSRFVNDNLAYLGRANAEAETSSWWLSPEIAAGLNLDGGNGWVYTPAARLRYAMQTIDGYSESGLSANATVNERDVSVAEGRLEIAASRQMESVYFTGRIGWLHRTSTGDDSATVTMLGISQAIAADGADRSAGYFGADLDIAVAQNLDLELGGEATFGSEITGGRFTAALVAKF